VNCELHELIVHELVELDKIYVIINCCYESRLVGAHVVVV
jgi:hypothetical protein